MSIFEGRKRGLGDRSDGYKVRNLDPMGRVMPYIMSEKVDSWVLFEERIDVTKAQEFVRRMAKEGYPGMSLYHLLFASVVRAISQVPQMNRFIKNNNIYARNELKFAMVVKKGMTTEGDRTVILPRFEPGDTLQEVYNKIKKEVDAIDRTVKVEDDENKNGMDVLEFGLSLLPDWLLRLGVGLLKGLDRYGLIPASITAVSPFHTTCFITNMGSFGMDAVYHHIYEFGTLSIFGALGKKETVYELDRYGNRNRKTYVTLRFVVDERATGGFEYGAGFKIVKSCFTHPEQLLTPPERVLEDVIDRSAAKKKIDWIKWIGDILKRN